MIGKPSEEIKERLDIVDLISEYIQLLPAGVNNFKAKCPFHNEKTPSFFVSKDKQIFKCFGCGEGGDVFSFVMKMEGLEFVDALRQLAKKAGVELRQEQPEFYSKRNRVLEILRLAAEYYHLALLKSNSGQVARNYISKRQLKPETINQFKIGFSPDSWEALSKFLKSRGYNDGEILASGLVVPKNYGDYYDRFRFRLMFPIWDAQNNVVGFTARQLREEKNMGKYINTPQSLVYDKSRILYGLNFAKSDIRRQDKVIVVEGNMDVIASHQVGVKNVVASSGTALTSLQIDLIKRYTNNVIFSFDTDLAGNTATERGIELALSSGLNIKIVLPKKFSQAKDPDEIIRKDGIKVWQKIIDQALPVMDYFFASQLEKLDLSKVEDKKKIAKFLLPKIKKISDGVEQAHYLQKLAGLLSVSEEVLRQAMKNIIEKKYYQNINQQRLIQNAKALKSETDLLQERLFGLIMISFDNIVKLEKFNLSFLNERISSLYKKIKEYYNNNNKSFDFHAFSNTLEKRDSDLALFAKELVLAIEKEQSQREKNDIFDINVEVDKCLKRLIDIDLRKKIVEVEALMRQAELARDDVKMDLLSKQFDMISMKLKRI